MFISFIIPVYNLEQFISDAINSLLQQNITDYEVILIDDNSSDNSTKLCKRFCNDNPHITLIQSPTNLGPGSARNAGIDIAKGDYIFFLDGDDQISSNSLLKLQKLISKYDLPELIHINSIEVFGRSKAKQESTDKIAEVQKCSQDNFLLSHLKKERIGFRAWEFLIKRSLLENNNIRFGTAKVWEDNDFIMRCLFSTKEIFVTNILFYQWRIRLSNSLTSHHAHNWHQMILSAIGMLKYIHTPNLTATQKQWVLSCVNSCLYEFEAIAASVSTTEYSQHINSFSHFIAHKQDLEPYIRKGGLLKTLYESNSPQGAIQYSKSLQKKQQSIIEKIPQERDVYGFPATRKCMRFINNISTEHYNFRGLLDNSSDKQGLIFDGYTIFTPEIIPLCYNRNNLFILIITESITTERVLTKQLESYGLIENKHFLCLNQFYPS